MFLMADISHWNSDGIGRPYTSDDFDLALEQIDAIMFKATEASTWVDGSFANNAWAANRAGLPWGAYHFVRQGRGREQAQHFYEIVMRQEGCQFLCIDWEDGDRTTVQRLAEHLVEISDVPVGDYIGYWAREHGGQLGGLAFHMVPQYGTAELEAKYATDPLSAWQYTNGQVNGTDMPSRIEGIGPCDVSVVYHPQHFGMEQEMALSDASIRKLMNWVIRDDGLTVVQALRDANRVRNAIVDAPDEFAQTIAAKIELPAGVTAEQVRQAAAQALRSVFADAATADSRSETPSSWPTSF